MRTWHNLFHPNTTSQRLWYWCLGCLLLSGMHTTPADAYEQPNAAQLQLELARLGQVGRVLYVAAHPDDENTGLLGYLASAKQMEVAYLSITRGDGGQNLIGSEQAAKLGIIRTQELLQARRIDGAIQFFTRAKDFGYSKSSQETLRFWGRDAILADVVRVIRTFRPDVVITRFPEKGNTHGHHLASAQLARAAYLAAGDPKLFPDQLKQLKVWTPRRLLHNVSTWMLRRRGLLKRPDILSQFMRLDIGGYEPLLGRSHGEISAASRSMHKSQGFGRAAQRGPIYEYFQHLLGTPAKSDLLEGVQMGWQRFAKGDTVGRHIKAAQGAFQATQPTKAVPHLLAALKAARALPSNARIKAKVAAIQQAIQGCLGLYLDARAKSPFAVPGHPLRLSLRGLNRSTTPITLQSVQVLGRGITGTTTWSLGGKALAHHRPWRHSTTLQMAPDAPVSAPSWLRQQGTFGTYHIPDARHVARPEDPAPLQARFGLKISGTLLYIQRPIRYVWTDRVHGEQTHRVEVMPPATATPELAIKMFPNGRAQKLALQVQAYQAKTSGTLQLRLPPGWQVQPPSIALRFAKSQEVQRHTFLITPPKGAIQAVHATPEIQIKGRKYTWKVHFLRYPHIPQTAILEPARIKLVPLSLKPFKGTIGYIEGSGDLVPASLRQVGVRVNTIDKKTLRSGELSSYQTIVTGIRAFNASQTLRQHQKRLLDWVAAGGTLLVQYNTVSWWRPTQVKIGPYPMTIGRARVTDETAPITAIAPQHPVLSFPHRITPRDYQGWVQERGLYFATRWDRRYTPILQMADPGKRPTRGSLLIARHGKGIFVYTGISFFRQLPAGVPGAYRLLLNLLSHHQHTPKKAPHKAAKATAATTKSASPRPASQPSPARKP